MVCGGVLSSFSHLQLFATPWTAACQSPLSMGFSRQPYWSGLPCPPPGDLPDPGIKLVSLMSPALAGVSEGVKLLSCFRLFATPWMVATRLLCPWDFPGKSSGVDCHFLLQGIFPTQGSNPGLRHCRQTLYHLSHQGRSWQKVKRN